MGNVLISFVSLFVTSETAIVFILLRWLKHWSFSAIILCHIKRRINRLWGSIYNETSFIWIGVGWKCEWRTVMRFMMHMIMWVIIIWGVRHLIWNTKLVSGLIRLPCHVIFFTKVETIIVRCFLLKLIWNHFILLIIVFIYPIFIFAKSFFFT